MNILKNTFAPQKIKYLTTGEYTEGMLIVYSAADEKQSQVQVRGSASTAVEPTMVVCHIFRCVLRCCFYTGKYTFLEVLIIN